MNAADASTKVGTDASHGAARYLGIEIGGTKLQLAIGRGQGEIEALVRRRVNPSLGAEGIRAQIVEAFAELSRGGRALPAPIRAIGIGFGGPVDPERGTVLRSFQIDGWDGFPITAWAAEALRVPTVVLQNDSDAAGLAEARFGAGRNCSPLLYTNIGSGIGGALVLDGHVHRGFGQGAAEIGHLLVPSPLDRQDEDGAAAAPFAELEQVASGWAIARAAQTHARAIQKAGGSWPLLEHAGDDPDLIDAPSLARAAAKGDLDSQRILAHARSAVAFALAQAVALVAPRRIVLGGGVSLIGENQWLEPIRHELNALVFPPFRNGFDLVPAALGEEVVIHGALALARDAATANGPQIPLKHPDPTQRPQLPAM